MVEHTPSSDADVGSKRKCLLSKLTSSITLARMINLRLFFQILYLTLHNHLPPLVAFSGGKNKIIGKLVDYSDRLVAFFALRHS